MDKNFIKQELSLFEEKYIKYKNLRIYCGTFNVNGKLPDESLSPWLCLNSKDVDIYAIGFQELVDLTTTNLLIKNDTNEQLWTKYIEAELLNDKNFKSRTKYRFLTKNRMFGLFLVIYVNENLIEKNAISEVLTSQIATGIMDMVGNKGSLGVSLKLYETRVCFVCSHFAADTDKLEKRNSDFRTAKFKLTFQSENRLLSLGDHETIFWFGDLNYRVDKLTLTKTLRFISEQNYEELLKYDQLNQEKKLFKIFDDYYEGRVQFRPTYKYLTKSDLYEKQSLITNLDQEDTLGRVKLPSWTDRVLWKSQKCNLVQYSCINTITISDHKPVYALFDLDVKKIDKKKYASLYENFLKESDRKLNELMPHIELDKFEFNFGPCYFYDVKRLEMIVRNKGATRSNVDILFYENQQDTSKSQKDQWVNFIPQHKERFEPNTEYRVELSTCFTPKILPKLIKMKKLDDFLIVRCLNGNDSFATICCEYKPTIIGMSLKGLSSLTDSFDSTNFDEFLKLEEEIEKYEKQIDIYFSDNLKNSSVIYQMEKLERYSNHVETEKLDSRIKIYNQALEMSVDVLHKDEFYTKNLSEDYKFLLEYLIKRCGSTDTVSNGNESTMTIEEQKNMALVCLSKREFKDFEGYNFDLELLAELFYDLLYTLPCSLIPRRYLDYCCYLSNNTQIESIKLFEYIPKSHLDLFKLTIKFLRIYLKNLSLNESNYTNMIADAMFQIDKETDNKTCVNLNAFYFLKLFIDNENFI